MTDGLNRKITIGYFWNMLTNWLNRLVGLLSTLILIRLLDPIDFGVATLAMIVMTFFSMLADSGTQKYVIRAKDCTDELLNSAWSLNLLLKLVCGFIIALLSGYIAEFIREPALEDVLLICSLIPIISAFKNIGVLEFERRLNYKPLAQLTVMVKFCTAPVTVFLAVWWQSYWALVVGLLVSELLTVIGSYRIHQYRPKLSMRYWGRQWGFSKWFLVSTTTGYIRSRIDVFLLGRYLPSSAVGTYRVSQEFAWLPFTELISPATSSLYAGFSKIRENRQELNKKTLNYLAVSYLLVMPSVFGIYALSEQFVSVLMGEQWLNAAPVLALLSILMLSMPLNMALQTVLINIDKVKYLVYIDLVMIGSILACFFLAYQRGIESIIVYTQIRVMLASLFILLLVLIFRLALGINIKGMMKVLLLPVPPALIMFNVLELAKNAIQLSDWLNLLTLTILGGSVYILLMILIFIVFKSKLVEYELLNVIFKDHILSKLKRNKA